MVRLSTESEPRGVLGKRARSSAGSPEQREWDGKYGEGNWEVGYVLDGRFVSHDEALEAVYYRSYERHFEDTRRI